MKAEEKTSVINDEIEKIIEKEADKNRLIFSLNPAWIIAIGILLGATIIVVMKFMGVF